MTLTSALGPCRFCSDRARVKSRNRESTTEHRHSRVYLSIYLITMVSTDKIYNSTQQTT